MGSIKDTISIYIKFESKKKLDKARKDRLVKLFDNTEIIKGKVGFQINSNEISINVYEDCIILESNKLDEILNKLKGIEKIFNCNINNTNNNFIIDRLIEFDEEFTFENSVDGIGRMLELDGFMVGEIKYFDRISEEINDYNIFSVVRMCSIKEGLLIGTTSKFNNIQFIKNIYNASDKYISNLIENKLFEEGE